MISLQQLRILSFILLQGEGLLIKNNDYENTVDQIRLKFKFEL
jgi:hypothetical protein